MKIKDDYITPEQRTTHVDIVDRFIVTISCIAFLIQLIIFFIS